VSTFLSILLLVTLGLLTTGSRFYRLRRSRTITALHSGGWLAMIVGVMLGPIGAGLIDEQALRTSMPLLQIGLGWIGFMVGQQLQRPLLALVPAPVWKLSIADALMSTALAAAACVAVFWFVPPPGATVRGMAIATATLCAACFGWAMETRSQGFGDTAAHASAALHIRTIGGLGAAMAVTAHGLTIAFIGGPGESAGSIALRGALLIGLACAAAGAAAVLGAYGLAKAGRERDQQLAVFLGMLAVVAGLATQTGAGTLLASMLAGALVANISGTGLREFERFVLRGEHAVATIFSLLTGVLLSSLESWTPCLLAFGLLAIRLLAKPLLIARFLPATYRARRMRRFDHSARWLAAAASMRQSPIALAIAVSMVLVWPSPATKAALMALALAGVLAELTGRIVRYTPLVNDAAPAAPATARSRARRRANNQASVPTNEQASGPSASQPTSEGLS
jgi:hypothetical protein